MDIFGNLKNLKKICFLILIFLLSNKIFAQELESQKPVVQDQKSQDQKSVGQESDVKYFRQIVEEIKKLNENVSENISRLKKLEQNKQSKEKKSFAFSVYDKLGSIINACDKITSKKCLITILIVGVPIFALYSKFFNNRLLENFVAKIASKLFKVAGTGAVKTGASLATATVQATGQIVKNNKMATAKVVGAYLGLKTAGSILSNTFKKIGESSGKFIADKLGYGVASMGGLLVACGGSLMIKTAQLLLYLDGPDFDF